MHIQTHAYHIESMLNEWSHLSRSRVVSSRQYIALLLLLLSAFATAPCNSIRVVQRAGELVGNAYTYARTQLSRARTQDDQHSHNHCQASLSPRSKLPVFMLTAAAHAPKNTPHVQQQHSQRCAMSACIDRHPGAGMKDCSLQAKTLCVSNSYLPDKCAKLLVCSYFARKWISMPMERWYCSLFSFQREKQ